MTPKTINREISGNKNESQTMVYLKPPNGKRIAFDDKFAWAVYNEWCSELKLNPWGCDNVFAIVPKTGSFVGMTLNLLQKSSQLERLLELIGKGLIDKGLIVEIKSPDSKLFPDGLDVFIKPDPGEWPDYLSVPCWHIPKALLVHDQNTPANRILAARWSELYPDKEIPESFQRGQKKRKRRMQTAERFRLGRKSTWDDKIPLVKKILDKLNDGNSPQQVVNYFKQAKYGRFLVDVSWGYRSVRYVRDTYGPGGPKANMTNDAVN